MRSSDFFRYILQQAITHFLMGLLLNHLRRLPDFFRIRDQAIPGNACIRDDQAIKPDLRASSMIPSTCSGA